MYHFIGRNVSVTEKKRNKITVTIHNKSYTIVGKESRDRVLLVASLVDEKMEEINHSNKHLDTARLAVLTALNTMNDYVKLKKEYDELMILLEEDK